MAALSIHSSISDHKKVLSTELRQNQQAAQSAGMQAIQASQNALTAKGAAALSDAYEKIRTGTYDPENTVKLAQKGLISRRRAIAAKPFGRSARGED